MRTCSRRPRSGFSLIQDVSACGCSPSPPALHSAVPDITAFCPKYRYNETHFLRINTRLSGSIMKDERVLGGERQMFSWRKLARKTLIIWSEWMTGREVPPDPSREKEGGGLHCQSHFRGGCRVVTENPTTDEFHFYMVQDSSKNNKSQSCQTQTEGKQQMQIPARVES